MYKVLISIFLFSCYSYSKIDSFSESERVEYVKKSLKSMLETSLNDLANLREYIDNIDGGVCSSSSDKLKIDCLIESVEATCKEKKKKDLREKCRKYGDLVISNKLAEKSMISKSEKFKLMKKNKDYRSALKIKRNHLFSELTAKFYMSKLYNCSDNLNVDCLARSLDGFCFDLGNRENISWHHCVSAVSWFVGFYGKEVE